MEASAGKWWGKEVQIWQFLCCKYCTAVLTQVAKDELWMDFTVPLLAWYGKINLFPLTTTLLDAEGKKKILLYLQSKSNSVPLLTNFMCF